MNELRVQITADISALQSALKKAKQTLKDFDDSASKGTEQGNKPYERKIGLIEQLTQKAKALRTALEQATNEKDVARYNAELEDTSKQMTRLNALGRTLGNSTTGAAQGFNKLAGAQVNANGVAVEFSRIIQDAPFGIIGIGNNLQQLTANFAQVSKSAGGAGAAIKASLASLISPANLLVLGISAVTAAFTAYQMGAFDGLFATKDFAKELDNFKESLNAVDSARLESIKNSDQEIIKLNSLRVVIEDETVSREKRLEAIRRLRDEFPTLSKNLSDEALLAGQVAKAYEDVTRQLIAKAEVESSIKRIVDLNEQERLILEQSKDKLDEINEVRNRISEFQDRANQADLDFANAKDASEKDLALRRKLNAENQIRFLRGENSEVNQLLKIEEDRIKITEIANNALKETLVNTEDVKNVNQDVNQLITEQAERYGLINSLTNQIKQLNEDRNFAKDQEEINLITSKIDLLKEELDLINIKAKRANAPIYTGITPLPSRDGNVGVSGLPESQGVIIPDLDIEKLEEDVSIIDQLTKEIGNSFSALGGQIANSLSISNDAMRGFVSTLISSTPKIISAIVKTAEANKKAAADGIISAKKGALANGIFIATETGKALGPIGWALLPVLIGGAVALISGAFSKAGAGGGGGGGGSIAAPSGRSFTNAGVPSQTSPSYSNIPVESDFSQSVIVYGRISGDDILISSQRAQEKRAWG